MWRRGPPASRGRRPRATTTGPTAGRPAGRRRGGAATPTSGGPGSPLHGRPRLRPRRVVLALDVGPPVEAPGDRRRPVPDLVEERLVTGVVGVAERLVRGLVAGQFVGRRLAEPLGDRRVRLR